MYRVYSVFLHVSTRDKKSFLHLRTDGHNQLARFLNVSSRVSSQVFSKQLDLFNILNKRTG